LIQRCAPEPDICTARVRPTFICVIAAAYLFRRVHLPVARVSLRLGIPLGALATALVMVTGHFSADHVARFQPMKFAAIEGLWKHEAGPASLIVFARPQLQAQANSSEIKIPYVMSLLAGYGLSGGAPQGIREEVAEQEELIRQAISTWPLAPLSGSLSGYREIYDVSWRTPLESALRRTSCIAPLCAPCPMYPSCSVAFTRWCTSEWIVAEMGRQPWGCTDSCQR
jgi:cytochrome d ubiquinol oxidase subunit I